MNHSRAADPNVAAEQSTGARYLLAIVVVALLLGLARRIALDWDTPLWLDEAYTGAIAIQPSLSGLIQDCLRELGGPLYYALMWAWVKVAGAGNLALRLPSLIFALLAPLWLLLRGHPDLRTRMTWAALAALWVPGFYFATEARSYSLLFLLACVQVVFYQRLLREPSLRHAALWCGVSALMILTHYHALILIGIQGLLFLSVHRAAALRTWPAALLFVPAFAWMTVHLPLVLSFANPEVSWQKVLGLPELVGFPTILLGDGWPLVPLLLAMAATFARDGYLWLRRRAAWPFTVAETAAVGASLAAIAVVIAAGIIRPTFTPRYLIPFIPGLLLAFAVWARRWSGRWNLLPALVVLTFTLIAAREFQFQVAHPRSNFRWSYSHEKASEYLERAGARRLVFLWDFPTAAIGNAEQMARVGAFFFDRQGMPIPAKALILAGRATLVDPSVALLEAAPGAHDAVIWAYNPGTTGTLASRFPPHLDQLDPRWSCRDFGREPNHVVACARR